VEDYTAQREAGATDSWSPAPEVFLGQAAASRVP